MPSECDQKCAVGSAGTKEKQNKSQQCSEADYAL